MIIIHPLTTICASGMKMDTLSKPAIVEAVDQAGAGYLLVVQLVPIGIGRVGALLPKKEQADHIHDALISGKITRLSAAKMVMGTREVEDFIAKAGQCRALARRH